MDFISEYDLILSTNPYASITFGIIATIIVAVLVWMNTKEFKTLILVILTGFSLTGVLVIILKTIGYYG